MARDAGRFGQTIQAGGQVKVVAHFQIGVVGDVDHALRLAAPQSRSAGAGQIVGMDVVGVDVFLGHQHGRAFEQALTRRTAFAVGGVNAWDAQHTHPHAAAPQKTHQVFGIDTALGAWRVRVHGPGLVDTMAPAVAINTRGGTVDQRLRWRAQTQGTHQSQAARIALGFASTVGGRGCKVNHPVGNARQALQAGHIVQIALQRGDAAGPQQAHAFGRRSQRHQPHALGFGSTQLSRRAQPHIAAADDQNTLTAKAGRQCAQGSLV